jgi:hypothetical protein
LDLYVKQYYSYDHTKETPGKGLGWEMSERFFESFFSETLVDELCVETSFVADIDSIIDDNHRESHNNGK